jgi:MFS family permease
MRVLPIIVLAQFLCTSVWFAGNGVAQDLVRSLDLPAGFVAHLTSAVQIGFIMGTLLFALLNIADRFLPSRVFFTCSILAAASNLGLVTFSGTGLLLGSRMLTGFFLAGIYPVGMKIAADYFPGGLGKSLGLLVGALVAGTAFPHLLRALPAALPGSWLVLATSVLSLSGGAAMLLVGDGPYRHPAQRLQLSAMFVAFRSPAFRSAAFGYFGHMWELYAFWAFVPSMLGWYAAAHRVRLNVPVWSCCIIGSGALSCALCGYLSQRIAAKWLAATALGCSGLCCLLSPLILTDHHPVLLCSFLVFWGFMAVADSPMFSALVAGYAPPAIKGTALTIVTCIGFAITVGSIQLLHTLAEPYRYIVLGIGPVLGLGALLRKTVGA